MLSFILWKIEGFVLVLKILGEGDSWFLRSYVILVLIRKKYERDCLCSNFVEGRN